MFFRSHLENRLYNQNMLRLDHEIDRRSLETAWKSALDDCPFFDQGLMEQDGTLWFVPHASTCTAEDFSEKDLTGGTAIRSGDLAWTKVQGDRIRVGVSHALTDECGKKLFTCLLLYHYFRQVDQKPYPHPYASESGELKVWDAESDLMEDPIFPSPGRKPEIKIPKKTFVFPEHLKEKKKEALYRIDVDAKAFYAAMRRAFPISDEEFQRANELLLPIGKLQCVYVYLLLARVIAKVHPAQTLPVTLRCPVNTRSLCGKEDALRNFSLPQAVAAMRPEQMKKELQAEDVREIIRGFEAQLAKDAIGWQLTALKERTKNGVLDPDVAALYHQSMIVTNVGKEYYEPAPGRVLADERYAAGGYPFAVYLNRVGGSQIITISQSFETDCYYRAFLQELKREGITDAI